MNVADSEVVAAIMLSDGYQMTDNEKEADTIIINTCSVRDNAEQKVISRLQYFNSLRKNNKDLNIGVIGCMAERMQEELLERHNIDFVAGPDSYLDLPNLVGAVEKGEKAINIKLSKTETYKDVMPARIGKSILGFVSIMRGCNKFCSYCIVPYTRGRERSREVESIINEVKNLQANGYKEVTLLGQNVDSYLYNDGKGNATDFSQLLEKVALAVPDMRIRFTTSYPNDMTDQTLEVIAQYPNICRYIHLPVQSGSNRILKAMNRQHTREEYFALIDGIRQRIPDCAISQDMITGFPTETEEDHRDTLSLMEYVKYDFGFMFAYSKRPGTLAARKIVDDVPEEVKKRRLTEIIDLQQAHSLYRTQAQVGNTVEVLIEGNSKKSDQEWMGRNSQNTVVVFPKEDYKIGDFVMVKITDCTSTTLIGKAVGYSEYFN